MSDNDGYELEPGRDVDLDRDEVYDRHGNRITEEYVRRAVDDVRTKVGRGRPSLTGGREHSPRVSFRVPRDVRERAEQVAEREGKTVSQLAREAFEEHVLH